VGTARAAILDGAIPWEDGDADTDLETDSDSDSDF
jgi:hypothetical protein